MVLTAGLLYVAAISVLGRTEIQQIGDTWTAKNGYTEITVNSKTGLITGRGDYTGKGMYGESVLSGVGVESVRDGKVYRLEGCNGVIVTQPADDQLVVANIVDSCTSPALVNETISITLNNTFAHFSITGTVTASASSATRRVLSQDTSSIYSLFDLGVVQMQNGQSESKTYYPSKDGLQRLYSLGGFGPMEHQAGNRSVAVIRNYNTSHVVIVSKTSGSELHEVLSGDYRSVDNWFRDNDLAEARTERTSYVHNLKISVNNRDFPILTEGNAISRNGFSDEDYAAFMTGIYASPVGNLCTHTNEVENGYTVGQIATTIHRPSTGYSNTFNYFDPDNYISTSALLYSGDKYLQNEVFKILERNGDFINSKGQLPHHFVGVTPTYNALSGETQTGPNVFWILSCFNYVKLTGNVEWLRTYMPKLRTASSFLFDMMVTDSTHRPLLSVPGSLMIDVFIRNNMTTDTNAMVVGFFREFAEAEILVGNHSGGSALKTVADEIADKMNDFLWDKQSNDHFITQLNSDGTTTDFVDYDANFIAASNGIIKDPTRVTNLLKRIDGGRCSPGHTFVSEKYYGPHDTTSGNIGDSYTSMGRIAWFDALTRKLYNDSAHFDNVILNPLARDVLKYTWLHERYTCTGEPMVNRTASYFEYPSTAAMLIHRIRYGIDLGLNTITISPFPRASFSYHAGTVNVDYSQGDVSLKVPGVGKKQVTIEGMYPSTVYTTTIVGCGNIPPATAKTDSLGTFTTQLQIGLDMNTPCSISILKQ